MNPGGIGKAERKSNGFALFVVVEELGRYEREDTGEADIAM